jgi:hypothetical protein
MKRTAFFSLLFLTQVLMAQSGGESCATATVINSIPFVGFGSTVGMADDHYASCPDVGNQGGAPDAVYKYTTGNAVEYISLTLCISATNYDSQLYLYQGSCSSANIYACQEDGCQSPAYNANYNSEILNLMLAANTDYYIVVDGYSTNSSGTYQLNITQGVAPPAPLVGFTDMTSTLLSQTNIFSGVAMAAADMNNDGYDDIVRLNGAEFLRIEYQTPSGGMFSNYYFGDATPNSVWGMCIGDINDDGNRDIILGDYSGVRLLTANGTNTAYTSSNVHNQSIFVQGINCTDFNNDGMLDLFVCNDVGESHIYINNGTGTLQRNTSVVNLATTPPSDMSGNYASIFTDYDDDGDIDFYITKCRQGVTNAADPRRINQLFRNDNGVFTEVGLAAGLRLGEQSWVTDFGDINNDGLLDAFIMHHDAPSQMFINNGDGTFTDITVAAGLDDIPFAGIQCLFRDFNNDGWVDLIVAGGGHKLFINNQNNTFTESVNPFVYNNHQMESYCVGDFNHDGYLDVYAGYANLFNSPSSTRQDKLFMNDAQSSNNFVNFTLQGTTTNRDGIGAKIKLYGPWGVQVREVRSGEGYGIHNSFNQHFGLGPVQTADSAVIIWPSGTRDELPFVQANQWITVVEGAHPAAPVIVAAAAVQNIAFTTAEVVGNVLMRGAEETLIEVQYWPIGGSSTTLSVGIYPSTGGNQVVPVAQALSGLTDNTAYAALIKATYDNDGSASQTTAYYSDTIFFNTFGISVAEFDPAILKVYPNPAGGFIHFDFSSEAPAGVTLEIRNTLGQMVMQMPISKTNEQIDLGGQSAGTYFYSIGRGNEVLMRGIFVKN